MLTWLESWLHSIIAVVLFAVIVELLLPNSKFLRYTRLVIGLILLITILSPVLKVFEQDYLAQVDASYALWEKQISASEKQALTLTDIQAKAVDLQQKRDKETLKVTAKAIAEQMEQQLKQAGISYISNIAVSLALTDSAHRIEPYIQSVVVTVSISKSSAENEPDTEDTIRINDVKPISIDIANEIKQDTVFSDEHTNEQLIQQLSEVELKLINSVLQKNWNIKQNQISIVAEK